MDKKTTFELLDAFVEAGGNFIDTYVLQGRANGVY
jgi:aryl-alcohol dehydrogenase-like predicted oxidoreductase